LSCEYSPDSVADYNFRSHDKVSHSLDKNHISPYNKIKHKKYITKSAEFEIENVNNSKKATPQFKKSNDKLDQFNNITPRSSNSKSVLNNTPADLNNNSLTNS